MASIEKVPGGYRARWRTPEGASRSKTFTRKLDATRWLDTVRGDLARGVYLDPSAGRRTLQSFAEEWLKAQSFDDSSRESVESRLRVHVYPQLGHLELRSIRPSTVQAWIAGRQKLAPRYVRVIASHLSSILGAAVEDGLIARNPCSSSAVRTPPLPKGKVVPWPAATVADVAGALPDRYRVLAVVGAGCGLRQGELFGLRPQDVDFLRRRMLVRQQLKITRSRMHVAPPKGGKEREVPLPEVVALALAEHMRVFPPASFVFTDELGGPINRNHFNSHVWKPALVAAKVAPTRENGCHALRHTFASMLLEAGTSIRAVAEYLGHSDPGFTLRTYTHLMPSSEDRARKAIDEALGAAVSPACQPTADEH